MLMNYKKLAVLIMCAVLAVVTAKPVFAVTEKDIETARKNASAAEEALTEEKEKLAALESDKNELEGYLAKLHTQLEDLNMQLDSLDEKIEQKELELEITKAALERVTLDEEKQYKDMKARIRFMYEKGNKDLIVTLLSSESITELLNRADQFEKITGYDRNRLLEYQETKEAKKEQTELLETEEKELTTLRNTSEEKQKEIGRLAEDTGAKIDEYVKKIGEEELTASDLEKKVREQQAALNELIERAERERREAEARARREAELRRLAEEKAAKEAEEKAAREAEEKKAREKEKEEQRESGKQAEEKEPDPEPAEEPAPDPTKEPAPEPTAEPTPEPTKEPSPEPTAEPTPEPEPETSSETYLGKFKVTAYCPCAKCCGRANQATASGKMPRSGHTVAMGGVPFGTKLRVGGTVYTVEDRGTPYGHVDIFFDTHSEALAFGLKYMDVYQLD